MRKPRVQQRLALTATLLIAAITVGVFAQTGSPFRLNTTNPFDVANPVNYPIVLANDNISSASGTVYKGAAALSANRWLHNFTPAGANGFNVFLGAPAGNFTAISTYTITGATNVNPIVITSAVPTGIFTAATVTIAGVLGNTAANGTWVVTRLSPTTFSIPVAGNGAYTSGGTVTHANFGSDNIGIGGNSLRFLTSGWANTAVGHNTMNVLTTGIVNSAFGQQALSSITTGYENTGIGSNAGSNLTTAAANTCVGADACTNQTTADFNVCLGADTCRTNLVGTNLTAVGTNALNDTTGSYNTAVGGSAGVNISSGTDNTCMGAASCTNVTTGLTNTFIGRLAGLSSSTQRSKAGCIGYNCVIDQNNSFGIGGIGVDGVNVGFGGVTQPFERISEIGNIDMLNPVNAGTAAADLESVYFRNDGDHATSRRARITAHAYAAADQIGLDLYSFKSDGSGAIKALSIQSDGMVTFTPITFAVLGTPANGTLAYCSDCTKATPCAGGGTGAFSKRINGAWDCN